MNRSMLIKPSDVLPGRIEHITTLGNCQGGHLRTRREIEDLRRRVTSGIPTY